MKNIHVIPTDKPSRLLLSKRNNLQFLKDNASLNSNNHFEGTYQNIYITSNEEIKEDWFITNNNEIFKCIKNKEEQCFYSLNASILTKFCNKIILTTDQDLIKDSVQQIDDEFLTWFINNPSCESVDVIPLRKSSGYYDEKEVWHWDFLAYKIIIPSEEPETNLEKLPFQELVKEFAEYYKNVPLVKETLEAAAERLYPENWESIMDGQHDSNSYERNAFIEGAKSDAAKDMWYAIFKQEQDNNEKT